MREAADQIRNEVGHMLKDVGLLGERVRKLQTHFGQANNDIEAILTSTGKIEKRAVKIEDLEFEGDVAKRGDHPCANDTQAGSRRIAPMTVSPDVQARSSWFDAMAVYSSRAC